MRDREGRPIVVKFKKEKKVNGDSLGNNQNNSGNATILRPTSRSEALGDPNFKKDFRNLAYTKLSDTIEV